MTLTFEAGMHVFMTLCFIVLFIYFLRRWGFHLLQWVTEAGSTKICIAIEAAQRVSARVPTYICAGVRCCACGPALLLCMLAIMSAPGAAALGRVVARWRSEQVRAASCLWWKQINPGRQALWPWRTTHTHTKKIKTGRLKGSKQSRKKKNHKVHL